MVQITVSELGWAINSGQAQIIHEVFKLGLNEIQKSGTVTLAASTAVPTYGRGT